MDNLALPFDQYTRNNIVSTMVNKIRSGYPLKILDMGGRGGHLSDFLPKDDVYVIDTMEPAMIQNESYIQANIIQSPFSDKSFDTIVSTDVYEHISPENRIPAVSEMLRLSKNYVLLAAPFYSREVAEAELMAYEFYMQINGEPHRWLEEHKVNSLPSETELEEFLLRKGYEYFKVGSNNISIWLIFQFFIFFAGYYQIPLEKINDVSRFYNENIFDLGDNIEPTYRKIYLIGMKGTVPLADGYQKTKIDQNKLGNLDFKIFNLINENIKLKISQISSLESRINQLNEITKLCESQNDQLNQTINRANEILKYQSYQLQQIENSIVNKYLRKYAGTIEKILPIGTKRRSFYEKLLSDLR